VNTGGGYLRGREWNKYGHNKDEYRDAHSAYNSLKHGYLFKNNSELGFLTRSNLGHTDSPVFLRAHILSPWKR
jgi:hypothetical protein